MPHKLPKYLRQQITRHGKAVFYVRLPGKHRIRLWSEFNTPEFWAEYNAAIGGNAIMTKPLPKAAHPITHKDTLAWLIDRYYEAGAFPSPSPDRRISAWCELSAKTQKIRRNIFNRVIADAGNVAFASVTREKIIEGRNRRTPHVARQFMDAMRAVFGYAVHAGLLDVDPTADVTNLRRPKTQGFMRWDEAEIEQYRAHWPRGTMERVWVDVLYFTMLRVSDAVLIGPACVANGEITVRTVKSKGQTEVTIPIVPELAETLAAGPCGKDTFICGAYGEALKADTLSNYFSDAARAAGVKVAAPKGVKNKSAHGIRKASATRLANEGATTIELMSAGAWENQATAEIYTQDAARREAARKAFGKLSGRKVAAPVLKLVKAG